MWKASIRYEIHELLGEGSQGSVYKALRRDPVSGLTQTVAAKILHSKNAVDLWRREFESLARVRSPYCVQVHAFERLQGRPALILEYVEGASLFRLANATLLNAADISEVLAQIEAGLRDLHQHQIFHGDLSPHNVLVDIHGRIRLLDFGLANSANTETRLTPEFAAPERLSGRNADLASDLFSLGRIEQFLRGEKSALNTDSPYLHPEPSARRARGLTTDEAAQKSLALKVFDVLERKRLARQMRTRTLAVASEEARSFKARIVAFITSGLVLTASGASQSHDLGKVSPLHIRTEKWVYVSLDGSPLGYAPLSVPLTPGKTYNLEWLTSSGRGHRRVSVEAGRELLLTDRDFSH